MVEHLSGLWMFRQIHLWTILKVQSTILCNRFKCNIHFTCCTFSLVPKLTLVSYSFSLIIQPTMVKSCIHFWASISLMIISPTSGWKKVSSRCCLMVLGGIFKLTTKTHRNSIGCFEIGYVILRSSMQTSLETNSIWVGTFYGSYWK